MILTDALVYRLTSHDFEMLCAEEIGKLHANIAWDETRHPVTLLDNFDGDLCQNNQILIQSNTRLTIFGDGIFTQPFDGLLSWPADLSAGLVKQQISHLSQLRRLMPIASLTMQNGQMLFLDDEHKTQLRARLYLLENDHNAGSVIVSLQPMRGYTKALARVSSVLQAYRCHVDIRQIFDPRFQPYVAKPEVELGKNTSAFDAATNIIDAHLPIARANETGIISDLDTEFLHDYRIALRKIRSVLSLFKGVYSDAAVQKLKIRFGKLMEATGRLRDLDVYLLDREVFYDLLPSSQHSGLQKMFDLFEIERSQTQLSLAQHLQGEGYQGEIQKLQKKFANRNKLAKGPLADHDAAHYACGLIWARYRKICKIASAITHNTADDEIHELRIHCKKLRYLMEFFAPLFPKADIKSLIKSLKVLQDNLGLFNDYAVQQDSLRVFLEKIGETDPKNSLTIAQSVGALIVILHQRQASEKAKVMGNFAQFNSTETQSNFERLFKKGQGKS